MKYLFLSACSFFAATSFAQNIHYSQFDATPLSVNPAFTGMFDGHVRVSGIYRNQWASVTFPYITYGTSVDMPVFIDNKGNYFAAGIQLLKDQAGDNSLANFNGLISVAYHKFFRKNRDSNDLHGSSLAVGIQGGYSQSSIDISTIYFGDEFINGSVIPPAHLGLMHSANYYAVNAGICFSYAFCPDLNFTIGIAGYNLNQPNDAIEQKNYEAVGLYKNYIGEIGAVWNVSKRLSLRPAILYQSRPNAEGLIAGNEFYYTIVKPSNAHCSASVFLGGWYRTSDATMINAGVEFKRFRIGVSYDYNISTLNNSSNGSGGFEIAVRYVAPGRVLPAHKRETTANRF